MNSLNDILFVGSVHNATLTAAVQLPGFPDLTIAQLEALAREKVTAYYENNNLGTFTFISSHDVETRVGQINASLGDPQQVLDQWQEEAVITPLQYELATQLLTYVKEIESPSQLESTLFDWEQEQNTLHEFSAVYPVLGASVIARNSAFFWYEANTNPNDPWHPVAEKFPSWAPVFADLAGFVIGASLGDLICGPPCGAAGGTLLGSVSSGAVKN